MKNTIRKIIIAAAAVLFAAFLSSAANAQINVRGLAEPGGGGAVVGIGVGYSVARDGNMAASNECVRVRTVMMPCSGIVGGEGVRTDDPFVAVYFPLGDGDAGNGEFTTGSGNTAAEAITAAQNACNALSSNTDCTCLALIEDGADTAAPMMDFGVNVPYSAARTDHEGAIGSFSCLNEFTNAPACTSSAPIRDATTRLCRLPTNDDGEGDAECASLNSGANPIFDAARLSRCRLPSNDEECGRVSGAGPIFDTLELIGGNGCRLPNKSEECRRVDPATLYYNGTTCVAASQFSHCPADIPFYTSSGASATGNCRAANDMTECGMLPAMLPIYDNPGASATGNCRLPTDDDGEGDMECMRVYSDAQPIFDESQSDNCRPRESNADCPTTAPYFDSTETVLANQCRLPNDNGGNGDMECMSVYGDMQPIFDESQSDNCRPRESNADCPATAPYFDSTETVLANQCRLPNDNGGNGDMECFSVYGDAMPVFADGEGDKCRPRSGSADCPADAPYFDSAANECRLPTDDDGNGNMECASINLGAEPIFDATQPGNCRATANTDCEMTEFYNEANTPPTCDTRTTANNDCIGGQTVVANLCEDPVCEATHEFNDTAKTCDPRTSAACNADTEVFSPASAGGGVCISAEEFLAAAVSATVISPQYTVDSCGQAEWETGFVFSTDQQNAAEVCEIPVVRDDTADDAETAAAAESAPLQFSGTADGCIIRKSADVFGTLPDCADSELFGETGEFPQMPEGFAAGDRLTVAVVADGKNRVFFGDTEIRAAAPPAPQNNNDAEIALFGAVGLGMAAFAIADFLHDGRPADVFAFSSDFGYSINESGYFVRAGGKIEYAASENLRMHWSAAQTNTGGEFGDFRYLSEAKYTADFWTAAFSESVAGKTADYNLSLSANLQNGIWKISPIFRMHSEWKEKDSGIETETQNELNLEGEFRYNRWTISPSAGFGWQNFGEFADNGKFRINAIHRF